MSSNNNDDQWHLSKSVPITFIFAILLQTFTITWWASGVENHLEVLMARPALEERVIRLEALSGEYGRLLDRFEMTLNKIDTTLDSVQQEQLRQGAKRDVKR